MFLVSLPSNEIKAKSCSGIPTHTNRCKDMYNELSKENKGQTISLYKWL